MQLFPNSNLDQSHGGAESQPESCFGAFRCQAGLFPMRALALETAITGLHYRSTLKQRFINAYDEVLEATYVFPLPGRSAVTACTMKVGERTVEAELAERAEAQQRYDEAVQSGHRAALGEEERPEVFSMTLGNLAPGDVVTVELELAGELSWDSGIATYRFPLVVAPRYIPGVPLPMEQSGDGQALDTDLVPDASRISPPVLLPGFPNPVQLSVDVTVDDGGLGFQSAHCNLPCSAVDDGEGAPLHLRLEPGQRLDRDLLVRIPVDLARDGLRASALFRPDEERETDSNGHAGTLAVTVIPPTHTAFSAPSTPRDVVFLLDRSGSMTGWGMVAARSAAARLVESLDAQDQFRVIAFDTTLEEPDSLDRIDRNLAPASDKNRYDASRWLNGIEARGGTEMEPAFKLATECLASSGDADTKRERAMVVVTDGHVGNEHHLLRLLGRAGNPIRVFTVGVDMAVNAGLLERLATATGGSCTLVQSEAALNEGIEAVRGRIGRPAFTGAQLGADGVQFDGTAPQRHSDAYPGKPWTVLARCSEPLDTTGAGSSVHLHATAPDGQPIQLAIPVTRSQDAPLGAIWARWRIRDLEDAYASGPADRQETESEILRVSLAHQVLSRFTAWIAVDETETVTGADASTRRRVVQAVESPAGWDMMADCASMGRIPYVPSTPQMQDSEALYCMEAGDTSPFMEDDYDCLPYIEGPAPTVDPESMPVTEAIGHVLSLMTQELDQTRDDQLIGLVWSWFRKDGALQCVLRYLDDQGLIDDELQRRINDFKSALRKRQPARLRACLIEVIADLQAAHRKLPTTDGSKTP